MGAGIALYFSLANEPAAFVGVASIGFGGFALLLMRHRSLFWRTLAGAILCIAIGFGAAQLRTHLVHAPILKERTGAKLVEGSVLEVEQQENSIRYLINVEYLQSFEQFETPKKIRVSWRGDKVSIEPGQPVRMRVVLSPPPEPVLPGGYDFARQLYFQGIGAVGYAVSAPEVLADEPQVRGIGSAIEMMRFTISNRIYQALSRQSNEVAAICVALVTGKRSGVSEQSEQKLRDSGLAHLLAISGLHMGLAAGILFFAARFLLACHEHVALHYPIKKWAAIVALVGAFAYLLLSGAGWSTRRAFIMAAVFFIAILLDRRAISLRNVAIAATLILMTTPEALFQAGFQMSFAAVTVLIAAYEWYQRQSARRPADALSGLPGTGGQNMVLQYFGGLSVTSLLAGFATSPFGIFHFNRFAVYGLAGNLLAMPVMGFLIMPAAIVAFVLMPFGLDEWGWRVMGHGVGLVLSIAGMVAAWPGAVSNVAQIGTGAFFLFILGGLLACLLQTPLRLVGLAVLAIAMVIMPLHQPADIMIARDGRNMAFHLDTEDGAALIPLRRNTDRFSVSNWRRNAGFGENLAEVPDISDLSAAGISSAGCRRGDCEVVLASGELVAVTDELPLPTRLCDQARVIILQGSATEEHRNTCSAKLIDMDFLEREGATSIRFRRGAPQVTTNRQKRGRRPWSEQE